MNEDQRFADRRTDVITFRTPVLEEDLTLAGDILAHLEVSTIGTAADWVVKLIDVYPDDEPRAGHRATVQIQSTWFPLFDRNTQTYVENIFPEPLGKAPAGWMRD